MTEGNGQKTTFIDKDSAISISVVVMLAWGAFWLGQASNRLSVLEANATPLAMANQQIIERLARLEAVILSIPGVKR